MNHTHASLCLGVFVGAMLSTANAFAAVEQSKFQDWTVDCPKKEMCVAHLERKGVQILVGRVTPNGAVRMALRVSAAAKPSSPVGLRLADGWQAGLRVGKCTANYCEAGVAEKSTSIAVAALSRNGDGIVGYELNDRLMLIPVSFAGFADAMKQVNK